MSSHKHLKFSSQNCSKIVTSDIRETTLISTRHQKRDFYIFKEDRMYCSNPLIMVLNMQDLR